MNMQKEFNEWFDLHYDSEYVYLPDSYHALQAKANTRKSKRP